MPPPSALVIPIGADPVHLAQTTSVLGSHHIDHHVTADSAKLRMVLEPSAPPLMVVVHGGRVSAAMTTTVRGITRTTGHRTAVVVLAEDLDDDSEDTLIEAGARATIGLPVPPARLRTRLLAVRRSVQTEDRHVCRRGPFAIDLGRREVRVGDREVSLTRTEFELLATLAKDPHRVMTRGELSRHVRMPGNDPALESHLSRLRKKIRKVEGPPVVETIRGVGYRFGDT